jgi:hypothetical protein
MCVADASTERLKTAPGQVCWRRQHLLGSYERCLHLSGPLHRVGPLPVTSQGVRERLEGAAHRQKEVAVEVEEAQEPL